MEARLPILTWTWVVVAIVAGLTACDSTFQSDVRPAVLVRSTVPGDSVTLFPPVTTSINVTFSRGVSVDDISLRLSPPPVSAGDLLASPTGRSVTWFDLELERTESVYRLLIGAEHMRRPRLIYYFVENYPEGAFVGEIEVPYWAPHDPRGTVVFALRQDNYFDVFNSETFHDLPSEAVTVCSGRLSNGNGFYKMDFIHPDQKFWVVAILDTNGDGRYSPVTDWWGYYHERGNPLPALAAARMDEVRIELGRPR